MLALLILKYLAASLYYATATTSCNS